MPQLEDLKPGLPLVGLEPSVVATVAAVVPIGDGAVQVFYRSPDGTTKERLTPLPAAEKPRSFHGSIAINASTAKMRLITVADEIISLLASDPNATINITVEINAEFPSGASDNIKRAVTENATALGFRTKAGE